MKARQIVAIVLVVAGVLALVYGGFSYTKETHEAGIGPLQFEIQEKERVNLPVWVGVALVGVGVVVFLIPQRS